LSIDPPGGSFAFTDAAGGSNTLVFIDTYYGTPGQSSFAYRLAFSLEGPLGGAATSIGLSDIYFSMDGNATGTYSCGGPARLPTAGVTCATAHCPCLRSPWQALVWRGPQVELILGPHPERVAQDLSLCAAISDLQLAENLFVSRPALTQSFIS